MFDVTDISTLIVLSSDHTLGLIQDLVLDLRHLDSPSSHTLGPTWPHSLSDLQSLETRNL